MYLRVTRTRVDPSKAEQAISLTQEVKAAAEQLPGLQGFYSGVDRATGEAIVVTLWDTQEHAQFTRESLGDVISRARELGIQMDAPEMYEVIAQR